MRSYYWQNPDSLTTSPSQKRKNSAYYVADDQDFWGTYLGIFVCIILFVFFVFVLWYPMSYYYYDKDVNDNGIHDARERYYVHRHGVW